MLKCEVFDAKFKRLGMIEKFTYCQYNKKFNKCGSFTLKCPPIKENIELLKEDRILWLENDVAGIIQSIKLSEELEINGCLVSCILDWRYVFPVFNAEASPIKIMYDVVNANCINSSIPQRNYDFLIIEQIQDDLPRITKQKTGGSVLEFLTELSEAYNIGFDVSFNPLIKKMIFKVIVGEDRTAKNEKGNKMVLFSDSLNNLKNTEYSSNNSSYRNITIVDGEAEEGRRVSTYVFADGIERAGYERRELYTDARDLQSEKQNEEGETIKIPDEEYIKMLENRGEEKLGECKKLESLNAEVRSDSSTNFVYGKDYFLGDYVTVIKESYGYAMNVQVTEITVTQDKNGYEINPTFGEGQPTLYDILKKKGVVN